MLHFDFTFNPKFLRQVTLDQSPDSSINTGRLNLSRWGGHRLGLSLSWLSNAIRFKLLTNPNRKCSPRQCLGGSSQLRTTCQPPRSSSGATLERSKHPLENLIQILQVWRSPPQPRRLEVRLFSLSFQSCYLSRDYRSESFVWIIISGAIW